MVNFNEYYTNFLGVNKETLNKDNNAFISEYRDKPLNKKYYYHFIISNYYGNLICSVSNEYFHIADKYFDGTEESINTIVEELKQIDTDFRVRKMHRFSYEMVNVGHPFNHKETLKKSHEDKLLNRNEVCLGKVNNIAGKAIPLTEEIVKNINLAGISTGEYIKRNKDRLADNREHVVIKDGEIVSRAFISEIYEGAGNIVVHTKEEYRNRGYGKAVVRGCIDWCFKEGVLPIYLVEDSNKPSLNIPKTLNFKIEATEFIVSK